MSLKNSVLRELSKGPMSSAVLADRLGAPRKKVSYVLHDLIDAHKVRAERGIYELCEKKAVGLPAKLVKLGKTFGFAAALDASGDIFIPGHSLHGAMPGDEITVRLFSNPRVAGSREGEVETIVKPNNRVVGTLRRQGAGLVLLPDASPDTPLEVKKSSVDAGDGDKVAAEIVQRGNRHSEHRVQVVLRFGSADSAKQNAKAILYAQGIQKNFPDAVKNDAKYVAGLGITAEDTAARRDLRDEVIFTIDSASTKDIDDAISAKKTRDGYKLGVHIADVSHYVKAHSELDKEALQRGTSVYFADSVVPMLPKALSNGICSLNPQEDRLAFSCQMKLDTEGRLVDYKFRKTVIRSRVKGVYSEINALYGETAGEDIRQKYAEVLPSLAVMMEIYEKLAQRRAQRGNMELDSDEAKLVLDENGRCVDIIKRQRGVSERMIEEFMLLANNAAANLARKSEIPFVYRVHDEPAADRIEALKNLTTALGVPFKTAGEVPTQQEYARLLDETRGTPLARPVHYGVLRSMAKAKYEPQPKGHYGLALDDYAHFTSPIRRYPDLAIHRILTDLVAGAQPAALRKRYTDFAAKASADSTEREITAQGVERDIDDCYKAEYMRAHLGETFEGIISSVVSFGIYVELPNTVEGLLHISQLSDKPLTLIDGVALTDKLSGKSYRIGEALRVRVAGVDVSRGNVDFCLV